MALLIGLAAFVSTFLGGLFALRFKDRLHLILGFSAGAVIGVAFFDLIPEALELGDSRYGAEIITSVVALGFAAYMLLDRLITLHSHEESGVERGKLGAGSLSVHSFIDGAAVGLAFNVSPAIGAIVSIAVLVHDFSDGVNTVNMILKSGGTRKESLRWLTADAVAPVLGVASTTFFSLPESVLGLVLASFAGFFLYIGASDLLPESHHRHPTVWTSIMTVVGMAVLYAAVRTAGI